MEKALEASLISKKQVNGVLCADSNGLLISCKCFSSFWLPFMWLWPSSHLSWQYCVLWWYIFAIRCPLYSSNSQLLTKFPHSASSQLVPLANDHSCFFLFVPKHKSLPTPMYYICECSQRWYQRSAHGEILVDPSTRKLALRGPAPSDRRNWDTEQLYHYTWLQQCHGGHEGQLRGQRCVGVRVSEILCYDVILCLKWRSMPFFVPSESALFWLTLKDAQLFSTENLQWQRKSCFGSSEP